MSKELIEQLHKNEAWLMCDGFEVSANNIRKAIEAIESQSAEIERLKTLPMKYRRMAFNAELQEENARLKAELKAISIALDDPRTDLTMTAVEVITSLRAENATLKAISSAKGPQHDLYADGDADAPDCIKDRNGQIVLGLCKKCGKAECELTEPCPPVPCSKCSAMSRR